MQNNKKNNAGFWGRHPFMANSMLVIFSSVFAILVIDLIAHNLFDIRKMGSDANRFFQVSSLLGWEHRPNTSGTWYAYKDGTRTHVNINAHGFPDSDRSAEKKRPRIALIGDSTTEFWEVEEFFRGQYALEKKLDGEFEVLNFGLRGAGTDQQYIRLINQVIHFSPDIVVYFFCINDIANNVSVDGKPYFVIDADAPEGIRLEGFPLRWEPVAEDRWLQTLLEKSFTLRHIKYYISGAQTHLRTQVLLDDHFELRPFKRRYNAEDDYRMSLLRSLISAMHDFTREKDIKFLMVEGVYKPALDPTLRQQVLDAYGDQFDFDKVSALLKEYSNEAGIEFLSLQRLVHSQDIDINEILHPEDTMHLNLKGVELYASAIADRIRSLGWLENTVQPATMQVEQ
jgi:lysophospholipase L1-like esterase